MGLPQEEETPNCGQVRGAGRPSARGYQLRALYGLHSAHWAGVCTGFLEVLRCVGADGGMLDLAPSGELLPGQMVTFELP